MKALISFSAALVLVPMIAFASEGGHSGGGGSGFSAEIQRATDVFIQVVQENPTRFPGVNPEVLKLAQSQILVTQQTIRTCDGMGVLEAVSEPTLNRSVFNLNAWTSKVDATGKVFLAGHERLVVTGYEKSNEYTLSNEVYKITSEKLQQKLGQINVCDLYGGTGCSRLGTMQKSLESIRQAYVDGSANANANVYLWLFDNIQRDIQNEKLVLFQLESSKFRSKKKLEQLFNQISIAVDQRMQPYIQLTKAAMQGQTNATQAACVKL